MNLCVLGAFVVNDSVNRNSLRHTLRRIEAIGADLRWQRRAAWTLLALACLAPRWAMAWRRDVLCTDGVFYIEKAEALRTGDFAAGLYELQLNLYPLLLAALRQVTGEYELTAKVLSVLCSTLAVIPLVALVQRWGGHKLGWLAGALYAFHPESIEWSPEVVRDPLFWLVAWTTLWSAWRAAETWNWRWFAVCGLGLSAAILTRFEGWFLALPLLWWTATAAGQRTAWRSLPGRLALTAAACPVLLLAINLGPLAGHSRWEWGRFEHFATAGHWLERQLRPTAALVATPTDAATAASPEPVQLGPNERLTLRAMRWGYRHTLARSWHPAWLYLTGCGVLLTLLRRGRAGTGVTDSATIRVSWAPLLLLSALLLGCVWVYFWKYQEINKRYFLLPLYCWLPYTATGLVLNVEGMAKLAAELTGRRGAVGRYAGPLGMALWLLGLAAVGSGDALSSRYEGRYFKARLGRTIAAEFGPGRQLLASEDVERIVGYYAQASHRKLPDNVAGQEAVEWLQHWQPELVVLWEPDNDVDDPGRYGLLVERALHDGWQRRTLQVDVSAANSDTANMIVLVRPDVALAAAERRAADKAMATVPPGAAEKRR